MKVSTGPSTRIAWGLDIIYIQAKRSSCFSAEARDYVGKIDNKIALIDGQKLAKLMIDHNLGVSPMATYDVKS